MDPVQNDLKLLGVKPMEPDDYNIHTPPLPKDGKEQAQVQQLQTVVWPPFVFKNKGQTNRRTHRQR